jgi:uroporphyrinogen-III decarboxylase
MGTKLQEKEKNQPYFTNKILHTTKKNENKNPEDKEMELERT